MKRIIFLILLCFLFAGCKIDPPINTGNYKLSDSVTISYDGYNSCLNNIENIDTAADTIIKLYGGSSSFENIIFQFNEETYIKSINISFEDSLSLPEENCRFVILYNNSNILYEYNYSDITIFNEMHNLSINKTCNNIKLYFASNNSDNTIRTIKLHTVNLFSE